MSFSEKFEQKMLIISDKIANQRYLLSIKNAFTALTPLIIVGAFALLIKSIITNPKSGLAAIKGFEFFAELAPIFSKIQFATYNMLALFAVFLIATELARINGIKGYIAPTFSLACYITIIPNFVMSEGNIVNNVIGTSYTDTKGLFLAMFVAIISSELFASLSKSKYLKIKLHHSVPSNVARAFESLLPIAVGLLIFSTGEYIFELIFNMNTYEAIYQIVQAPLSKVIQGLPGILLLILISQVFWVFGIHGAQIVKPIRDPLIFAATEENMIALEAGKELPNIVAGPFLDLYSTLGGSGATIGLLVAIFIASKREDHREIAKLSLAPGCFNINETMIFGIPIVLNPIMMIPFVVAPIVGAIIGYISTALGFAAKAVYILPWSTPPIINAYIATKGSIGAVVTQIVCIIATILIYLPFVKLANKMQEKEGINK